MLMMPLPHMIELMKTEYDKIMEIAKEDFEDKKPRPEVLLKILENIKYNNYNIRRVQCESDIEQMQNPYICSGYVRSKMPEPYKCVISDKDTKEAYKLLAGSLLVSMFIDFIRLNEVGFLLPEDVRDICEGHLKLAVYGTEKTVKEIGYSLIRADKIADVTTDTLKDPEAVEQSGCKAREVSNEKFDFFNVLGTDAPSIEESPNL